MDVARWNLLHPDEPQREAYVTGMLKGTRGPVVASTDYVKSWAEQIRPFLPKGRDYRVLGTDGFGRSDYRSQLREFFEIDRHFVVLSALRALADEGSIDMKKCKQAIAKYGIDPEKANPHHD